MKFLEYANQTQSNIIPKENFEELIQEVFGVISANMSKSLGPLGSNTTILDGLYTSATKDGHTIFKNLRFRNRYKSMIYNLISAPCNRLNNTVGDGTTTAIVLANNLFKNYRERRYDIDVHHRLPREFTNTWDEIIDEIINRIQDHATPLNPEDDNTIWNICYVSSNGNGDISNNVTKVYRESKSPVIKVKNSPTNKSYIQSVTGFEFPANLIDDAYARNEDLSVELNNIHIMIFDYKIDSELCDHLIFPINEILRSQGIKLLILAPSYDALLANTRLKQYLNYEYQQYKDLNLILGQYAIGKLADHQLTDLATVLKGSVINQEIGAKLLERFVGNSDQYDMVKEIFEEPTYEFYRVIGTVANAMLSCTDGTIFRPKDLESDERYLDALRAANKKLESVMGSIDHERQAYAFEVAKAQARISQLRMENYIYYVGADSALQKEILEHAVTDVIKCVSSSIKSGTVPGCQLTILKICNDMLYEIVKDLPVKEDGTHEIDSLSDYDKLSTIIIEIIRDSIIGLYNSILNGPHGNGMVKLIPLWHHVKEEGLQDLLKEAVKKCGEVIRESMEKQLVFDLETLKFSDKIITSAETDINVLMASSELVKLLISGNQCVFLDADINDAHDDTVPVYT